MHYIEGLLPHKSSSFTRLATKILELVPALSSVLPVGDQVIIHVCVTLGQRPNDVHLIYEVVRRQVLMLGMQHCFASVACYVVYLRIYISKFVYGSSRTGRDHF
ncbi:hypothetical protein M758_3G057700 [Ceratodon purpureus]|uniref:Uncharacterized protein n=1 Tax=Ceratodon purpureus TaxID=3225 RepID=A0A8T0IHN1_CERPU|nr:hypothetical protein KC19_3G058400 [Ceratodon purpureus]KAG0621905.1 hypothetical protein M758_3G057700 [Ceratodon purpureus]